MEDSPKIDPLPQDSTDSTTIPTPSLLKRKLFMVMIIGLVLLVITGSGAVLYKYQPQSMQISSNPSPTIQPTPSVIPSPTVQLQTSVINTPSAPKKTKAFDEQRAVEVAAYQAKLDDYKMKNGKYPNSLSDLIPEFAINRAKNGQIYKAPLNDPETGGSADIVYQVANDGQSYTMYGILSTGEKVGGITIINQYPGGN